jgi:hypothetical protein
MVDSLPSSDDVVNGHASEAFRILQDAPGPTRQGVVFFPTVKLDFHVTTTEGLSWI